MLRWVGFVGGVLAAVAIAVSGYAYAAEAGRAVAQYDVAWERYEALKCIGGQIEAGVPPEGSYAVGALPHGADPLWRQWLIELGSPQRQVVADLHDADYVVVLVTAGPRAVCGGYGVDMVAVAS